MWFLIYHVPLTILATNFHKVIVQNILIISQECKIIIDRSISSMILIAKTLNDSNTGVSAL